MRCICKNDDGILCFKFVWFADGILLYGYYSILCVFKPFSMVTRNKWTNKNEDGWNKIRKKRESSETGNGNCIEHNCILQILFLYLAEITQTKRANCIQMLKFLLSLLLLLLLLLLFLLHFLVFFHPFIHSLFFLQYLFSFCIYFCRNDKLLRRQCYP